MQTMTGLPESEESCPLSRTLSADEEVMVSNTVTGLYSGAEGLEDSFSKNNMWLMADRETNWWNQQIISGKNKKQ